VPLYQEVVRLVPNHTEALIALGKYYLEAHLTGEVTSIAEKVLAKDPQHPQAKALKIAVLAVEDQLPEAVDKAVALKSQFPDEPDVAVLLGALYAQQQRYGDAEATLRRALKAVPANMDLLRNLNTILVQANDMVGAETVARRMIEREPMLLDHRIRLAGLFHTQGANEKADVVLREAIALDPRSEERHLLLADFLVSKMNHRAAEQALREAATKLPHSTKIRFSLARLHQESGEDTKAREEYASLVKDYGEKPAGLEAKVKLAEMDILLGKQHEAQSHVLDVLKKNPRSSDGLVLSGRLALSVRNGTYAIQAFRTVLNGQAYLMTGENNLAKRSFEQAVEIYSGQLDARRSLAALDTQSGRHQQARARLLRQRPDDLVALQMLFHLDLATGMWFEAEGTLNRLRAASKDKAVAFMAEGRLRQAQGHPDKAITAYESAAALAPTDPDALLSLVRLDLEQHRPDRAMNRLNVLLTSNPDHLFGHGLLAEVLAMTGHFQEADGHFKEATRVNPKWITPWLDWGSLWLTQKEPSQAAEIIQAALKVNPGREELFMLLASAYSAGHQVDPAIAAYNSALRLNPRNVLAANNLAVLLVDFKGDPKSLQQAFVLSRDFEKEASHPLFLDTLGWVRFKMGQQEEAQLSSGDGPISVGTNGQSQSLSV
jgi:cellulose synthase operon protein C